MNCDLATACTPLEKQEDVKARAAAPEWVWLVVWGDDGQAETTTGIYVQRADALDAYIRFARYAWENCRDDDSEDEAEIVSDCVELTEDEREELRVEADELWNRLLEEHG